MSSIEMRLAALEAQVVELKTENELLKMLTPLEAITEGLKAATPAEVEGWMAACEAVAGKMPAPKANASKAKTPKDEKKNTNPTGPAEFNAFIQAIWHEMAAVEGVVGEHNDAFKKASKEVGVTFQKAPKAAKPAAPKAPVKAAPKPAAPKAPVKAAPKPAAPEPAAPKAAALTVPTDAQIVEATTDYDDAMRTKMKAECEGYGWQACVFAEKACWLDPSTGDVFSYDSIATIGVYDAETGEFCETE